MLLISQKYLRSDLEDGFCVETNVIQKCSFALLSDHMIYLYIYRTALLG